MSFLLHHLTLVFPFTFPFCPFINDKKTRKMNTKRHSEDRAVSKGRKKKRSWRYQKRDGRASANNGRELQGGGLYTCQLH